MEMPMCGVSILGIDPGGTTGVCVYDAWQQQLYVEQLDAGHGRKTKYKVHGGVIESGHREDVKKWLANKYGVGVGAVGKGGAGTEAEIADVVERGVCQTLLNMAVALGPRSIIVIEDFVLAHGGAVGGGLSSGRATLAPVRIGARLEQVLWDAGVLNGDAWRIWQGHGWGGRDVRGWNVQGWQGEVPGFVKRLTAVEKWRLSSGDDGVGDVGVAWGGEGSKFVRQMPAARCFVRGGVKATAEVLRGGGYWRKGMPHGMDACMHVMAVARKLGATIPNNPERIFPGSGKPHKGGITAKTTRSP